jgi:predicted outer membrane protein
MRAVTLALAGTLLLAGCATKTTPTGSSVPQTRPGTRGAAASSATYVAQAASIDLFVVRSSELAQQRASDPRIRSLAQQLIADHTGLASQLSLAGRRLDLLPGASMLPAQQAMFDELSASGDFDRAFVRLQRSVHGSALSLHSAYATRGDSPTLRPVAANAAAVERRHLDMLRGY